MDPEIKYKPLKRWPERELIILEGESAHNEHFRRLPLLSVILGTLDNEQGVIIIKQTSDSIIYYGDAGSIKEDNPYLESLAERGMLLVKHTAVSADGKIMLYV